VLLSNMLMEKIWLSHNDHQLHPRFTLETTAIALFQL
jgi:hypothetical protein